MAQRRMFSQKIIGSDAFLEMPVSARELYFQFGMYADDDGFISPRKIMRMIGASDDDLKVLITKRFVLPFENGVIVIKHWLINNLIRKDFYQETQYFEQKKILSLKENKAYTRAKNNDCQQIVNNLETQIRLGKDRLGKDNKILADKKSAHAEIMKFYSDLVQSKFGFRPKIDAADGKLLKSALSMGVENIRALVEWYLDSDKCRELEQVSLSACLSKDSVNKWRLSSSKPKRVAFMKIN